MSPVEFGNVQTLSATGAILVDTYHVVGTNTSGAVFTLPLAADSATNRAIAVKRRGSAVFSVAAGGSDSLDGTLNGTQAFTSINDAFQFASDGGTDWYIVADHP